MSPGARSADQLFTGKNALLIGVLANCCYRMGVMSWLNQLEKVADPIAVPGLIRYVAFLSSAVFIIGLAMPDAVALLNLQPDAVLRGEIWRVFTFAFIPSSFSLFWIFALLLMFFIGDGLEQAMGATRLTLFYLLGWFGTVVAAFVFGGPTTPIFMNLALLLAFGTLYPDVTITLFFILPVKVKWIALFSFVLAFASTRGGAGYAALAVGLGNYLLFFGPAMVRMFRTNTETAKRRHEFKKKARPAEDSLHRCKVCARTEHDDADLEFRVSGDGEEYCTEHLPSRSA